MIIIKNSEQLSKLVDTNKDLFLKEENVKIEFEPKKVELRDVHCGNLYLQKDNELFDFHGRDFIGGSFNGRDFHGGDFIGVGFNGKKVNYYGVFICYSWCKCVSIKGRRVNSIHKVLDGEIEFIKKNSVKNREVIDLISQTAKEVKLSGEKLNQMIEKLKNKL